MLNNVLFSLFWVERGGRGVKTTIWAECCGQGQTITVIQKLKKKAEEEA